MADLMRQWLSEKGIYSSDIEQDFANGYLLGKLLHACGLQTDFESFANKGKPDAYLRNYTKLQPTLAKLGVPLDTRTARALINKEAGLAGKVLYNIKQAVSAMNATTQVLEHSGKTMQQFGVRTTPTQGMLDVQQHKSEQAVYETGNLKFFEDVMRKHIDNPNVLMESLHLKRFADEGSRQAAAAAEAGAAEAAAEVANKAAVHDNLRAKLAASRADKSAKLQRDAAIHAAILKRKGDVERQELKVEMALAVAAGELGIAQGPGESPMATLSRITTFAPTAAKLAESGGEYLSAIKTRHQEEAAARKEREVRRRKLLVEQQAARTASEQATDTESLLEVLVKQSAEEQKLGQKLWLVKQEKVAMAAERRRREEQYAAERDRQWEQSLMEEAEHLKSVQVQHKAVTQQLLAACANERQSRAAAKLAKRRAFAGEVTWQLVQLAERVTEYRAATAGQAVPRRDWRAWMAMFIAGDPSLGSPVVSPGLIDKEPEETQLVINRAELAEYLACTGDWLESKGPVPVGSSGSSIMSAGSAAATGGTTAQTAGTVPPSQPLQHSALGRVVADLAALAQRLGDFPQDLVQDRHGQDNSKQSLHSAAQGSGGAAAAATPEVLTAGAAVAAKNSASPARAIQEFPLKISVDYAAPADPSTQPDAKTPKAAAKASAGKTAPQSGGSSAPGAFGAGLSIPAGCPTPGGLPLPPHLAPGVLGRGFVIDGFPATATQAALLEKALTGVDTTAERALVEGASLVAPPPKDALPQLERPLVSGLDAVLVLAFEDEELAIKRAVGRRVDPATGRVYHLDFDPPIPTTPGLAERLTMTAEPGCDAQQVSQRLSSYATASEPLGQWLARFSTLQKPLDGTAALTEVVIGARDVANGILAAKVAAHAAKAAADAASRAGGSAIKARECAQTAQSYTETAACELLALKKAEVLAAALLNTGKNPDPASIEVLKGQAAAKCAEQLKAAAAAAAEAAKKAEACRQLSQGFVAEAEKWFAALDIPMDAAVPSTQQLTAVLAATADFKGEAIVVEAVGNATTASQAAAGGSAKVRPLPAAATLPAAVIPLLRQQWQLLESAFVEGMSRGLAGVRQARSLAVDHVASSCSFFRAFLHRADAKQAVLQSFVERFNAVELDMRKAKETQGELMLRGEELRDALWAICDSKHEEAEAARLKLVNDGSTAEHISLLGLHLVSLVQGELDRFQAACHFLYSYCFYAHGVYTPYCADKPLCPLPTALLGAADEASKKCGVAAATAAMANTNVIGTNQGVAAAGEKATAGANKAGVAGNAKAAAAGQPLPHDLRLEDDLLVVDESKLLLPAPITPPTPRPPSPALPPGVLSVQQLQQLATALAAAAPGGFLVVDDAAQLMLRMCNHGVLPESWQDIDALHLVAALARLDPTYSGYLDWRQLLLALAAAAMPAVQAAGPAQVAAQVSVLTLADKDKDGFLTQEEFEGVQWWWGPDSSEGNSQHELSGRQVCTPAGVDEAGQHEESVVQEMTQGLRREMTRCKQFKQLLWSVFQQQATSRMETASQSSSSPAVAVPASPLAASAAPVTPVATKRPNSKGAANSGNHQLAAGAVSSPAGKASASNDRGLAAVEKAVGSLPPAAGGVLASSPVGSSGSTSQRSSPGGSDAAVAQEGAPTQGASQEAAPAAVAPLFNWRAALLYLCPDRDLHCGVLKAAAAVTGSSAATSTLDTAAVLLYGTACERVMTLLLHRYHWIDVFIAARL
eukprot:gene2553-2855_t